MKQTFTRWGAILCALFALLTIAVLLGLANALDRQTTILLQSITPRVFDMPFSILSILGSAEIGILFFLVMLYLAPSSSRIRVAILFALSILIPTIAKITIYQAPIPGEWMRYTFPFGAPTSYISTAYSFPSGHVTRASFLVVLGIALAWQSVLSKRLKQIVTLGLTLYLAAMVYSRPYLAEHWLSDAIGGTLLGIGLGFLVLDRMRTRE